MSGRRGSGLDEVAGAIAAECVAVRLRVLNRVVTAIYDDALRPYGVKASQVNVLTVVALRGPVAPGAVGRRLCLEKSTLSRNVERMRARGWVEMVPGDDERSHRLQLTAAGRRLLRRIFPAWRRAQGRVRRLLGRQGSDAIARMAEELWKREAA